MPREKMTKLLGKAYRGFLRNLPQNRSCDELAALVIFLRSHRRLPKINGGLFNDFLFYLKTSDEILDPRRVFISDKEYVKKYVSMKVGDRYNVPTLGVVRDLEEAYRYRFPDHCVIKPTHMSGPVMFRKNGGKIDFSLIEKWFSENYYLSGREANYKDLNPKLIIEPYIFDMSDVEDFKIFCVIGEPRVIQVDSNRHGEHTRNFYTTSWEELPFSATFPKGEPTRRPVNLDQMLSLAATLSADFNMIRVDLYSNDASVLVGELTNCPGNATMRFLPAGSEKLMTDFLFGEQPIAQILKPHGLAASSFI